MAKPSKGKKSLKPEQKAASRDKAAQKGQSGQQPPKAVQAEIQKSKPAAAPEKVEPTKQASIVEKSINFFRSSVTWYTVALVIIMAFMFYMRTVPAHDAVFTNWPWINGSTYVNVAEDDGVYHMRLLYNTLQHFPFRIMYDPFTHFPYGNTIHFGPLFELIPAAFLLIIGLGHPAQSLIDTVAAYYPAFLGILVVIPVYYTGKKLFGRRAGLVAAIILAFLPGAFFWRSMLGSTDHHIAEVLFMASTVACLVYALDAAKGSKLSLEHLKNKDWKSAKMPLIYAALTGLFFGCYLLNWVGAMLLAFILFAYFTLQAFVDHLKGRPLDYIPILAAFVFLIPTIMVLPYSLGNPSFQAVYYSLTQPVILIFAFIAICAEYLISRTMQQSKVERWAYPVSILGISVIGLLLIYLAIPGLFGILNYGIGQLWPSGGTLTIREAYPTFRDQDAGGIFSFKTVWYYFFLTFPASILGLLLFAFRAAKKQRPSDIMFLVWNLVMFWALIAQNRYTYYFALNASLLTAYLAAEMFNAIRLDDLWASFRKKVDSMESFQRFVKKNMGSCLAVAFVLLVFGFIAVYPTLPMSDLTTQGKEGALFQCSRSSPGMPYEWYDALMWMRNHTPDPQGSPVNASLDYWSGQYYKSPSNKTYDYPASAYGVMSWWDYGHMITYIANRIPNANPFQAGIIEENGTTGASPFFCSTDENRSVQMLDALGSRYVIIDNEMASTKFYAIQSWIGDTEGWKTEARANLTFANMTEGIIYDTGEQVPIIADTDKWNSSIMNRLYYGDASGMSHYRLVYESAGSYALNFMYMQFGDQGQVSYGMLEIPLRFDNYTDAYSYYDAASRFALSQNNQGTFYIYSARPPAKWVKIFEKVEGATLTGSAPDGASVTATLTLKTDWDRTFNYTATTVAHNGTYSFVVPYPTEQMKGDGYSYGIMPQGEYSITYGNTTKSVAVPESAVMNGATIQVS
ncbi:putative membrane oligosaccharyl transferase, required for N-linked glycosylation [Methanocella conradii HZ254]|uniref:dolichyl-phosphooligosaccharide-protein glycotransferase n=1 Tax=Methanocella conradii (strain DSM 24694 / JCM 17849 / CGMCC 1.5162 / HZ254) TaxID=1041930 RepID=H8I8C3_METCZ|nr:oligosaccharyl transferase, archaeosortase A system-associated [Methanocella conradii]AFC98976.1 putative membrane oligosaccharyl transferase, required for N-linked glycosylation [Methanocella conradii HZ254]